VGVLEQVLRVHLGLMKQKVVAVERVGRYCLEGIIIIINNTLHLLGKL
jgi:hypothetical protein